MYKLQLGILVKEGVFRERMEGKSISNTFIAGRVELGGNKELGNAQLLVGLGSVVTQKRWGWT